MQVAGNPAALLVLQAASRRPERFLSVSSLAFSASFAPESSVISVATTQIVRMPKSWTGLNEKRTRRRWPSELTRLTSPRDSPRRPLVNQRSECLLFLKGEMFLERSSDYILEGHAQNSRRNWHWRRGPCHPDPGSPPPHSCFHQHSVGMLGALQGKNLIPIRRRLQRRHPPGRAGWPEKFLPSSRTRVRNLLIFCAADFPWPCLDVSRRIATPSNPGRGALHSCSKDRRPASATAAEAF